MSGIGWIFNGDKCGFTGDATILVPLVKLLTLPEYLLAAHMF